jgi:predicted DsbA family dithiol-disulfide isomerase
MSRRSGHSPPGGAIWQRKDRACWERAREGKYAEAVKKDMAEAQKAGATGTPSFVLARTDPSDPSTVRGITFLRGARPFEDFKIAIERALGAAAK